MKKVFFNLAMFTMFAACLSACSSNDPDENTPKEKPQDINFMVVSELTPLCGMNESEMLDFLGNLGFLKQTGVDPGHAGYDYYFTRGKESIGIYTYDTSIMQQIDYEAENMGVTPAQADEWFEYHGKSVKIGSKKLPLVLAEYRIDENEGESYNGLINGLKNCTGEEKNIDADLTYSPSEEIGKDAFVDISYTRENYSSLYDNIEITVDNVGGDYGKMEQVSL